eukprot:1158380-Pelagomonas_calceolata.AAC.9
MGRTSAQESRLACPGALYEEENMYLEEGRRIREAAEMEKARLAAIKARKLKDLEDAGVPAKYRAELEKYKLQIR